MLTSIWKKIKDRTEKRYQERSLIERLYLRLKYQPYYFMKALLYFPRDIYMSIIDDDWTSPSLLFQIRNTEWEIKAKWLYDFNKINLIDKVCENLKSTSEEFLNLFPEDMKNKLKDNFYLAGGCIYSLYNDKIPNDYDVFLYTPELKNDLVSFFTKHIVKQKHGGLSFGNYKGNKILKTKYAISIGDKFQIITKYIGLPQSVTSEFDFKHNMFYYEPCVNTVDCHTSVNFSYLRTKEMYFNTLRARDLCGVVLRLPKFISRGMTIQKKEIAKILTKLQSCINDENEKEILLDYTSTQGY